LNGNLSNIHEGCALAWDGIQLAEMVFMGAGGELPNRECVKMEWPEKEREREVPHNGNAHGGVGRMRGGGWCRRGVRNNQTERVR